MSLVAAIPKTAGTRPPVWPPVHTSFDPTPDPGGDPVHKRIAESVSMLIKQIDITPDEHLGTILDLLHQRRRWIEEEIRASRLLERPSLPPAIAEFLTVEPYVGVDDDLVPFYQRLANRIDDAIATVRARLWVLKQDVFTSER